MVIPERRLRCLDRWSSHVSTYTQRCWYFCCYLLSAAFLTWLISLRPTCCTLSADACVEGAGLEFYRVACQYMSVQSVNICWCFRNAGKPRRLMTEDSEGCSLVGPLDFGRVFPADLRQQQSLRYPTWSSPSPATSLRPQFPAFAQRDVAMRTHQQLELLGRAAIVRRRGGRVRQAALSCRRIHGRRESN